MKNFTLGLIISSFFNISLSANQFDSEFYKLFLQDNYKSYNSESFQAFNNITDSETTNELFVENCTEKENVFEKTTCFKITGQTGIPLGYMAYADFYFNRYLNSTNKNEKIKSIIFASKFYGLAEGLKGIPLKNEDVDFENKIQGFGDFLENPELKVNDLNPLVDFHMSGILDSLNFPINEYLKVDDVDFFNKSFFNIDSEKLSDLNINDYINNLIENTENKNAQTFLKLNMSKDNVVKILDSIYYGKDGLNKDQNNSLNYLYEMGFYEKNINALKNLQLVFYRELKLNNELAQEEKNLYIDNILKISAKIFNIDKDNENIIVNNIIDEFANEKTQIIEYVQKYNKYRKYSQ